MLNGSHQRLHGKTGRRGMSRLRLAVPATVLLLSGTYRGTLLDLSRSGARLELEAVPRIGSEVVVQAVGFEAFGTIVWLGGKQVGIRFDRLVSEERMIAMREVADDYPRRSRETMHRSVQEWVRGSSRFL